MHATGALNGRSDLRGIQQIIKNKDGQHQRLRCRMQENSVIRQIPKQIVEHSLLIQIRVVATLAFDPGNWCLRSQFLKLSLSKTSDTSFASLVRHPDWAWGTKYSWFPGYAPFWAEGFRHSYAQPRARQCQHSLTTLIQKTGNLPVRSLPTALRNEISSHGTIRVDE